jgi:hypothetical protein
MGLAYYMRICQCVWADCLSVGRKKEGIQLIVVDGLKKEFNGFLALKGLDMHVERGDIWVHWAKWRW